MPGSDQFVNYQIRPAKSVERKMICDLIKELQVRGALKDFRYIGMGAKYFADFMLIHHQFGTTKMISIESQREKQLRYDFNKPLGYIEMKYGYAKDMLPQIDSWEMQNNLVWLDYDGPITDDVIGDIETVVRNCKIGDLFIITVNSSCKGTTKSEKRANFQNQVNNFFDSSIPLDQYTNKGIARLELNMMNNQVKKTLRRRNRLHSMNIKFDQLLNIEYKDSAQMLTYGIVFLDEIMEESINYDILKQIFPFISNTANTFALEVPSLTNKEIQFILRKLPFDETVYSENQYHGIELSEIKNFEKIYRYYPYYSEGVFSN